MSVGIICIVHVEQGKFLVGRLSGMDRNEGSGDSNDYKPPWQPGRLPPCFGTAQGDADNMDYNLPDEVFELLLEEEAEETCSDNESDDNMMYERNESITGTPSNPSSNLSTNM